MPGRRALARSLRRDLERSLARQGGPGPGEGEGRCQNHLVDRPLVPRLPPALHLFTVRETKKDGLTTSRHSARVPATRHSFRLPLRAPLSTPALHASRCPGSAPLCLPPHTPSRPPFSTQPSPCPALAQPRPSWPGHSARPCWLAQPAPRRATRLRWSGTAGCLLSR